jgi:hypothetical protein
VGARAPFDRSWLATTEALLKMPKCGLVDLNSLRWDSRARCLPPRGFLYRPSLLASNTSWGASRAWLEPWPCMGASLVVPNSVTRGQLSNPGRGPAFDPSRFISGSEPVTHASRNIHPRILLLPVLGASFQEGKRDRCGSGQRGATVMSCIADTCPYLRILRELLGKVIE